ncbi:MAG: radical SAM protein [Aquificaceae bacterium]|nr:radical SAM protein [Aquificaceae bacterium]MDW8237929.1 radical SAM protein [Aquificaceae bacterium]
MNVAERLKLSIRLANFDKESVDFEKCVFEASARGKKVPLLKIMQTTACDKNCNYCIFRRDRDETRRVFLKPEEIAYAANALYEKGKIQGIFLSSGVFFNPEFTMQNMIDTASILRKKYKFRGYIHLKIMPKASLQSIEEAIKLANRVSVNLETTREFRMQEIAKGKSLVNDLLPKVKTIHKLLENYPGKSQITQLMVGVQDEKDKEVLHLVSQIIKKYKVSRFYFSAFHPIPNTPLEQNPPEDPKRELRLYQAEFLIREYGFSFEDFLSVFQNSNLPLDKDPKETWAEVNRELFPVNVNKAPFELLMRVPGIGRVGAKTIIKRRREKMLTSIYDLRGLRNLGKIARYITF